MLQPNHLMALCLKRRAPYVGLETSLAFVTLCVALFLFAVLRRGFSPQDPMLLFYVFTFFLFFGSSSSIQFYDGSSCESDEFSPGSRYVCTSTSLKSCPTFLVYRPQQGFDTVSEISNLFGVEQDQVLLLNKLTNASTILEQDWEVLIPIQCSCSGGFFQSNLSYSVPEHTTYYHISCEIFEGLVKSRALMEENSFGKNYLEAGMDLTVPLRCACPQSNNTKDDFKYLVTYPVAEGYGTKVIGQQFGISPSEIWAENSQDPNPTVYPNTTVLVPLRRTPSINSSVSVPSDRPPGFIPMKPTEIIENSMKQRNLYVIGFGVGLLLALLALFGLGFYCMAMRKMRQNKLDLSSARSSTVSCLSPDLIAGMSSLRYSLVSYSNEELSQATRGFSEETRLGASVHKGRVGGNQIVIKEMSFGDARRTISIHSQINHTNIVKLDGVCYGDNDFSMSYLVFEFARNGCLRDCLRNPLNVLLWHKRTQIAFDVAIGLHYIHHCTFPSYIHMNINSRNILVTEGWRAKIANLGAGSVINSAKERGDNAITAEGWIAPEYLYQGLVSPKVDVFAFGVVLLELISAKEARDGSLLRDSLGFLGGGGSVTGCFEELRGFMDPYLKDYPIGEALCVAVLAKACVEDDPSHRPTMEDILKILARMVR